MTTYDNIIDMLVFFVITSSGILVENTSIEDNRTLITIGELEFKLSKADKSGLCDFEVTERTETA